MKIKNHKISFNSDDTHKATSEGIKAMDDSDVQHR